MATPKQTDPQFKLRLTPQLRDEIEASAAANNRSMNAEIVHRLERSMQWDEDGQSEANALIETLDRKLKEAIEVNEYLEGIRKLLEERLEMAEDNDFTYKHVPEDKTLYVLLDADGMPVSWQEITLHLGEMGRAGNFNIEKIEARIFNADVARNNDREEEFWRLFEKYRDLNAKTKARKKGTVNVSPKA